MKLGIYSDVHLSKNDNRIDEKNIHNIHESVIWARDTFKKEGCELIINNGDMIDSDNLDSYTNYILSDIYKKNIGIKEIIICGNHEIKDIDGTYNSLCVLDNYKDIEVYNKIHTLKIKDDLTLVFQPYTRKEENIKELIDTLDSIKGKKVLFSHLTYINIPNIKLNDNIKGEIDYNSIKDKVDLIFNGHIHIALESDKYVQIGCITGSTFNDDYTYHKPGIIIFDTDTFEIKRIENPNAILYTKINYKQLSQIQDIKNKYFRIDCTPEEVEGVNELIQKLGIEKYKIKIVNNNSTTKTDTEEKVNLNIYTDPITALNNFIEIEQGSFDKEDLKGFIKEYFN